VSEKVLGVPDRYSPIYWVAVDSKWRRENLSTMTGMEPMIAGGQTANVLTMSVWTSSPRLK
jgi:hypothetical protein